MNHPIMHLIAQLKVLASGIGLQIARLPKEHQSPAVAAVEQTLRVCIEKLADVRTALVSPASVSPATPSERCDDDAA